APAPCASTRHARAPAGASQRPETVASPTSSVSLAASMPSYDPARVGRPSPSGRRLGERQDFHDLDGLGGKDGEVRVALEQARGRVVPGGLDDDIAGEIVLDVADPVGARALRLAERGALLEDRGLMSFPPCGPCGEALLYARVARLFAERVPAGALVRLLRAGVDGEEFLHWGLRQTRGR